MIHDRLIAHRGWQNCFPENTLLAIEQALLLGVKHIEIDIQLSADNIPMLCHDSNLLRFCGADLNINQCQQPQLAKLSAYEPKRLGDQFKGNPLCTLQECVAMLSQYSQATLYVEIKEESLEHFGRDHVIDCILPVVAPIRDRCQLISFDLPVLAALKQRGVHQVVPVLSDWQQAFGEEIAVIDPALVFMDYEFLTEGRRPDQLPYPCALYEIGHLDQATALIEAGAALIESFCTGELLAQLENQGT